MNWKSPLKIILVAAAGALVASPELQALISAAVPPGWASVVGALFGVIALLLRSPATPAVEPPVPQLK